MKMVSQERPATSEPTGIIFRNIIASIDKVLKTTKSFNKNGMIAIVGDLMVKNIYVPTYSDNKSNAFVKSISGAKTKYMKSYT